MTNTPSQALDAVAAIKDRARAERLVETLVQASQAYENADPAYDQKAKRKAYFDAREAVVAALVPTITEPGADENWLTPDEEKAIVEDINSGRWPYLTPVASPAEPGAVNAEMLAALARARDALRTYAKSLRGEYASRLGLAAELENQADLIDAALASAPPREGWSFREHLQRQRDWSGKTFGPGPRTKGVIDHIRKELCEIEADPADISEWIDVTILALDGAWRAGHSPDQIIEALRAKQAKNEARDWPDWRTSDPEKAIEHVPTASPSPHGREGPGECATDGCGKPATVHFERGGVGSHYCRDCYLKVQAIICRNWAGVCSELCDACLAAPHGTGEGR